MSTHRWPHKSTISDYDFKERTHELLLKISWQAHHLGNNKYLWLCPACGNDSSQGHADDCELAFLLNESAYSQDSRVSMKIRANIDHYGLWAEKNGIIASAKTVETEEGRTEYQLSYHRDQMPAHETKIFSEKHDLEKAMREFEPNLRVWKLVGSGV